MSIESFSHDFPAILAQISLLDSLVASSDSVCDYDHEDNICDRFTARFEKTRPSMVLISGYSRARPILSHATIDFVEGFQSMFG